MDFVVYKLKYDGASYRAVQSVHQSVVKMAQDFKNSSQGKDVREFKDSLSQKISDLDGQTVHATGLSSPVIQVRHDTPQSYPRAYNVYPQVFECPYKYKFADDNAPGEQPDLYMHCPVGFNGEHFIPDDARLIEDEKEREFVGNALFAGGWSTPFSYFTLKDKGTDVPEEYLSGARLNNYADIGHQSECFIAQGKTLEILADHKERESRYRAATDQVLEELKRIVTVEMRDDFSDQIPNDEGIYLNSSIRSGGELGKQSQFCISVRREGRHEIMQGGQPLELIDNRFFTFKEDGYSDYEITPRSDTKEGRALKRLFDNVPDKPSLADYAELHANMPMKKRQFDDMLGINGSVPRIEEFEGQALLVYNTDHPGKTNFCPPDSIPLPATIYYWLRHDREDRQMGISPPPQPEALKVEIQDLRSALKSGPQIPQIDDYNAQNNAPEL